MKKYVASYYALFHTNDFKSKLRNFPWHRLQQVVDQTTGKTGCVEFIRFVDLTGEFKPLTSVGGANIAFAMGTYDTNNY